MHRKTNITHPAQFTEKLQAVMQGAYDLLELAREHDLSPVSEDGVIRYFEEHGKACFQVSGQYDRPTEFLQVLLDIIRANFEPCVLGTLFLNSNLCFLYDEVPDAPFQLGYASLTSQPNQGFAAFWDEQVIPYLEQCGYTLGGADGATAVYAVASTGQERYGYDAFMNDISTKLGSGFSVEEATALLASEINEAVSPPRKRVYTGYCLDPALGSRIRLSLWLFIPAHEQTVQ